MWWVIMFNYFTTKNVDRSIKSNYSTIMIFCGIFVPNYLQFCKQSIIYNCLRLFCIFSTNCVTKRFWIYWLHINTTNPPTCMIKSTLIRNKRFMLDEMFKENTSKFAIFLEYKNPHVVCVFQKYGKFWSISAGTFQ